MKTEQHPERKGEARARITPEAAMKAFRNFKYAHAELSQRADIKMVVKEIGDKGEDPTRSLEQCSAGSLSEHTDADLRRMLEDGLRDVERFWNGRETSLSNKLFNDSCRWIHGCEGTALTCMNSEIVLTERMGEMLILLSAPNTADFSEAIEARIRDCFGRNPEDFIGVYFIGLPTLLHHDALARLVNSLSGEQIDMLISATADKKRTRYGERGTKKDIWRIARAMDVEGCNRLGRHLAIYPHATSLGVLLKYGEAEGRTIVEKLVKHMKDIADAIQERLSSLVGGQHV